MRDSDLRGPNRRVDPGRQPLPWPDLPSEPLSRRARATKEALLPLLERALARRRWRRRAALAACAACGVLLGLAALERVRHQRDARPGGAVSGRRLGDTPRATGLAAAPRTTEPSSPVEVVRQGVATAQAPRRWRHLEVEIVHDVPGIVERYAVREDDLSHSVARIGDEEAIALLRASGRSCGLIRVEGRVLVEPFVAFHDRGADEAR